MRSMQYQLGMLGTISAFAFRHRNWPDDDLLGAKLVAKIRIIVILK